MQTNDLMACKKCGVVIDITKAKYYPEDDQSIVNVPGCPICQKPL